MALHCRAGEPRQGRARGDHMNTQPTPDQTLRDVFRLLRRQRWVIVASALIAAAAAVAYSLTKTPEYEATAEIQFVDLREDLTAFGTAVPVAEFPKQIAAKSELVTSPEVVRGVRDLLGGGPSLDEIRGSVTTRLDPDNNLVSITARSDNSGLRAQRLANAFASETRRTVTRDQRRRLINAAELLRDSARGESNELSRINVLERASSLEAFAQFSEPVTIARSADEPTDPVSPQPIRDSSLALLLGLIVGVLLAFLRDSLDPRLTDAHEVQHHVGFPLVGYVGDDAFDPKPRRNGGAGGVPDLVESFRILRSNVDFLSPDSSITTVAVTSPLPEEGKSTVSVGLAFASAMAGNRVLLVECDMRRPVLAERFDLRSSPGLADWIAGLAGPAEVLQQIAIDGDEDPQQARFDASESAEQPAKVSAIVGGDRVMGPTELLASRRFGEFIDEVRPLFDLVVLDCAPILPVSDALEVLPRADSVLLCVRLDHTTREQALAAKAAVEHLPAKPTGLVVTGVEVGRGGYYYGYYAAPETRQYPVHRV